MTRLKLLFGFCMLFGILTLTNAQQKVYLSSGGEMIFSWGDLKFDQDWVDANTNQSTGGSPSIVGTPVRFTIFFHFGQFVNFDVSNNLGFYSGVSMRNVGIISDEVLPIQYEPTNQDALQFHDIKVIRRTYNLGVPLAIKIGSFKDHFFVYGGGEIEWAICYKEKYWRAHSRSGGKSKYHTWWPNQVNTFQPSYFVGLQFPGGINVKAKYYPDNFLNHSFARNTTSPEANVVGDLTKYAQSNLFYVSLSYHFNTSKITKAYSSGEVASR